MSKKLIPIIVVVLIVIVVVAVIAMGGHSNIVPATNNTSQNSSGFNNYYNPTDGVKFQYPSSWKEQDYNDPTVIHVVIYNGTIADFRFLTDDKYNSSNTTMTQYNQIVMQALSSVPGYSLINQQDVTVNGVSYHEIVYMSKDKQNNDLKSMQLWTLTSKKGYGFSYNAMANQYDTYLPQAQAIINSITLL